MAQQGPSITGPALSASAKDTRNKGAGSNARQRDLSSRCGLGALASEQDPGLGYSRAQRQGLFLLVPVNDSHVANNPVAAEAAPGAAGQAERRRGGAATSTTNAFPVSHLMVTKWLLLFIARQKFLRETVLQMGTGRQPNLLSAKAEN